MSDVEEERPGVNWSQVVAGALAAVSSAVLLSTLGVAGTVIGAALGSVIASVAGAWYTRGLDASRQQVAAQAAALKRVATARSRLDDAVAAMHRGERGAETGIFRADQALVEAEEVLEESAHLADDEPVQGSEPDGPHEAQTQDTQAQDTQDQNPQDRGTQDEPAVNQAAQDQQATSPDPLYGVVAGRRLPWKRIALLAGGLFVAVMAAITVFELMTGRAVSTYTGGSDKDTGSTVPGLREPALKEDEEESPPPEEQAPEEDGVPQPGDEVEPSAEPTVEPTVAPTPLTPEPTVTVAPTGTPSVEPSPTSDGSTGTTGSTG